MYGSPDDVDGLLNRGGNKGVIDRLRKVVDRRIGLDTRDFRAAGIDGIKFPGITVHLLDLEIGHFPSTQVVRCADDGHTLGIK